MKVVGCQPYAPTAFTSRTNLIFRGWLDSRAHGTVRCHGKKKPATPGIDSGTFRLEAQCLNHYATSGSIIYIYIYIFNILKYIYIYICSMFIIALFQYIWRSYSVIIILFFMDYVSTVWSHKFHAQNAQCPVLTHLTVHNTIYVGHSKLDSPFSHLHGYVWSSGRFMRIKCSIFNNCGNRA